MKRLLCLIPLVACGDDGAIPLDAPTDTSSIDAPTDAPPNPDTVKLTIREQGEGVEGVDVFFQNPDGSLAAKVATDANGVASATVMTGGYVTVVDPFDAPSLPSVTRGLSFAELQTFAGVKPGDELRLEQAFNFSDALVDVVLPTITNAEIWEVSTSCGGDFITATTGELELFCTGPVDFVVVAYDAASAPLGFFYEPNVLVSDGATIDLSTETYSAVGNATLAFTNVPAAFNGVEGFAGIFSPNGVSYTAPIDGPFTAGAASFTEPRPSPANTTAIFTSTFEEATETANEHMAIAWGPAATTTALSYNGTDKFMPSITDEPAFDAATRQLSWTASATTAQPDYVRARIEVVREEPLVAWRWEIVAPYTNASVTFPVLPTDLAVYNATATDDSQALDLEIAKLTGGYDGARETVFAQGGSPPAASGEGQVVTWDADDFVPTARVRSTPWRLAANRAKDRAAKLAKVKAAISSKPVKAKAKAVRAR